MRLGYISASSSQLVQGSRLFSWVCIVIRAYKKRGWLSRTSLKESSSTSTSWRCSHLESFGRSRHKTWAHCLNSKIFALGYEWQPSPSKGFLLPCRKIDLSEHIRILFTLIKKKWAPEFRNAVSFTLSTKMLIEHTPFISDAHYGKP